MDKLFAFDVAKPAAVSAAPRLDRYDPQRQQLVWENDGESSLGDALCTRGSYWGWNPCHSTGTSCTGTRCDTSGYLGCYSCDYG
jgi:hypothetical protein